MEWREQTSVSSEEAFSEAQRWIEAVTKKTFGSEDFRSALENGVLLCDLINKIKPGTIKKVNRLPTPIAGLDNLNVFLKACGKLGLKEAQLFHPGDLQDLSTRVTVKHQETSRRLKNVLITIYWLGRRAECDRFYNGPYLNFKAFEGLLGTALYKALHESTSEKTSSIRDSGFGDSWYSEREEIYHLREEGGHRRDDSLDSLDSLGSRPRSISSDATLKGGSEGCCSDAEADSIFRMAENKSGISYRRSLVVAPKATAQFNQFLPTKDKQSGYVPAPLRKKRAEQDSRRSWASLSYSEDEGVLTREQDELESVDGSKSTSDIMEPTITQPNRLKELQKYREQLKQGEDKWQDDLSKWKSRRRSVNSDIVKKKEEREKIEEITYGGSDRKSKTFKEMQEERDSRKSSIGSRLKSLSVLDNEDDDIFEKPTVSPYARALLSRSYTIDTPYHSSESFEPSQKTQEPPAASTPTLRPAFPPPSQKVEEVDSAPARYSSATTNITPTPTPASRSSINSSHSPAAAPEPKPKADKLASATKTQAAARPASFSFTREEPEPKALLSGAQTEVEAPSSGSLHKQPPLFSSMEPKPPAVSRVSATLPRSYQQPDSTRLTSVVAPRPFGSQSSRITSLPRAYTLDNANKRVNGDVSVSKMTSVPSRYQQFMTEDDAQSSSAHSSEDEDEEVEEEERAKAESIPSTQNISSVMPRAKSEAPVISAPAKDTSKEDFCDMRISLNQKPNSSRDFGFHAAWDSTGARVTSIQPGSPAEMCQLQIGDEVLMVNGHKVAEMSYTEWRSCLEAALQEGSLVMDVRRHGQNNWDIDQPSLPFKSHKIINLTSTDHPILLGSPETKTVKPSLDFTSRTLTETVPAKETPTHPFVDVASNRVNGNLQEEPVTMRNKESEPLSLKNLKRRSEFFEQGGSEFAVPDIPVPAITPPSSRWSWDPEEERKRQEKWQKEQERLLQEKYKRDQEKLQEEWLKAQQDIATSGAQQEVNSHNVSPRVPPSSAQHPTPPLWEEEERKRKVEQERQRQAEERRKREEEERQLRQLQEERKRREMQEEEERMRVKEEEERRRVKEEERRRVKEEEERRRMEEEKRMRVEAERMRMEEKKKIEEERKRMEEELRWQRRREEEREEERRQQEAVEQQRRERALEQQQWTRSKSTSQLDEDDLPARSVSGAGVTDGKGQQQQPSSQAELERQQILREMKKTTSLLTDNSWIRQRSSSTVTNREGDVPPMRRSVSGRKICAFCDAPLGKGAAMIIESLELCYHLSCFKCIDCKVDLGGSKAGTEVRIRNKQLYCNSCYVRFKSAQPTSI